MTWDVLIRGAKVFDGSGGPAAFVDVAVQDGRVVAKGQGLPVTNAASVEEAAGQWLIPGLLDIHTHEDLEVELAPGLPEVVRHGTTSVVVGNCSLGLAFGAQRTPEQDPIVDCFARVENIPKSVLAKAADKATWNTPREYLEHLNELPLAANLAPLIPHSMLRIQVMGLKDSIERDPTPGELKEMVSQLDDAMNAGYVGFSTDGLPLHFLANQPHVDKRIPTQYAQFGEYKALTDVVRLHDRVWQMTPSTDNSALTLRLFLLTSGRLNGKPLKITALAALDSAINRMFKAQALRFSSLLNSKLLNGHFRMQSLAAPFKVWSEGAISPLAEADPLLRRLIETELEDVEARRAVLSEPEFIEAFRAMWEKGKSGFNLDHLKRKLRMENAFMTRDLNDHVIYRSPVPAWQGRTMAEVYVDYRAWQTSASTNLSEAEIQAFTELGRGIQDEAEFFLMLLKVFDRDMYWHYVSANRDPEVVKELLLNPLLLPGFNDSGAHVTNMAFYDGNLRGLRIALEDSEETFSYMVKRLTREPAEFFGLDAGNLDIGSRADMALLNPEVLRSYDGDAGIEYIYRDEYDCHQLVNRSDGVVEGVYVAGKKVWHGTAFTEQFGRERAGQALTVAG
jgi:N-acyl-D-aspartate/D-glutamate deacylase